MKKNSWIVFLLFALNVCGQQTFVHTCDRSLYFMSSSPQPVSYKYLDVIITNHTACGYSYEITIDVNSYTIPDNFILYESINDTFIEIFQSGWIGHPAYWPYSTNVNNGYYEIVDGLPIREGEHCDSLPTNFYWQRWGTCNGFGRIRFNSSAPQVKIRCELNFVHTSYIEFSIHCSPHFEPITRINRLIYVCHEPAQIQEVSYSPDCLIEYLTDSIYVGGEGAFYDTIYLLSGQYHTVKGKKIYVDQITFLPDTLINDYGCIVPIGTLIIPYNLKVYIPNIFTPNGDGHNDIFWISTDGEVIELRIYDRWGSLVFTGISWDGDGCQSGVYVYVATIETNGVESVYSGGITLIR